MYFKFSIQVLQILMKQMNKNKFLDKIYKQHIQMNKFYNN
jgi:hypothetical protein